MSKNSIYKGEIWHITKNPFFAQDKESCLEVISDGALVVDHKGIILDIGKAPKVQKRFPGSKIQNYKNSLIIPGFIDTHLHFPQLDVIGSFGTQLLEWLETYTFPEEVKYTDTKLVKKMASVFIDELFSNGITSAMVYGSSSMVSVEHLFQEALKRHIRLIAGKVSMDRNAPKKLLIKADQDFEETQALIRKWHGKENRLFYVLTPRFAPTSTEKLLSRLEELKSLYPDVYIQTHHAESKQEIAWVHSLFPKHKGYLSIYDSFNLLGSKTFLAHSIHVNKKDLDRIKCTKTNIAHCPSSNLFLGSGLFPLDLFVKRKIPLTLGSDIGGGTSLSPWKTMAEAYKVQQLRGKTLCPEELFYLATLGGAEALNFSPSTGNFVRGKAADFQIIDPSKINLIKRRFELTDSARKRLFAMIILGDERLVKELFIQGKRVYRAKS